MSISRIIIAGNCIWQQKKDISSIHGVQDVHCGYTGGLLPYPSFMEISNNKSGDIQALEITYFDDQISFSRLLDAIILSCYKNHQTSEINLFYSNSKQKRIAEHKLLPLQTQGFQNIRILSVDTFYSYLNPKQYPQLSCTKNIFPLP